MDTDFSAIKRGLYFGYNLNFNIFVYNIFKLIYVFLHKEDNYFKYCDGFCHTLI